MGSGFRPGGLFVGYVLTGAIAILTIKPCVMGINCIVLILDSSIE